MIGRTVGHYRVLEYLGGGGMGVVYKAEDTKLGRTVALKFLPPERTRDEDAKERFLNEARTASLLDHANICTMFDIGETAEGQTFIAMPCYDGETLKRMIARGAIDPARVIDIATQIARGLQAAHEAGIIHRDIKPANIIVTSRGTVKILDFGLAKLAGVSLTKSGVSVGTIAYMAPEQIRAGEVSPATDLWALGAVMFEMLTGRHPFRGETDQALLYSIVEDTAPLVSDAKPDVPPQLDRIVDHLLRKRPQTRYASATELIADLTELADDTRLSGRQTLRFRWRSPRVLHTGVFAAVVAAAIAGVFFLKGGTHHNGPPPQLAAVQPTVETPPHNSRKMIAVLPFENLGAPDDAFFADGMTEEIISRLAAVNDLGVISRTSVYAYDRQGKSVRRIGADLGVDYVLEGSVRWERSKNESRVRVTPQLIRVSDDTHVWADRYDRKLQEVFAVQSDIADQVIKQLGVRLLDGDRVVHRKLTDDIEAYALYLRAKNPEGTEIAVRKAITRVEEAISRDPNFVAAHALLGQLHTRYYHVGYDRTPARLWMAKQSIDRSLALDPQNPEAHIALGYYHYLGDHDYTKALAEFETARATLPGDTSLLAGIAYTHRRQGQLSVALRELLDLFTLDPRNPTVVAETGITYTALRRYAEAEKMLAEGIASFPQHPDPYSVRAFNLLAWKGYPDEARAVLQGAPDVDDEALVDPGFAVDMFSHRYSAAAARLENSRISVVVTPMGLGQSHLPKQLLIGKALALGGDPAKARPLFESARQQLEEALTNSPDDDRLHSALGLTYAWLGRDRDAVREAEKGTELCPLSSDALTGTNRLAELAEVYAKTGDHDRAIDILERLLAVPSMISVPILRVDPTWDALRSEARFKRLVER